MRKWRRWAAASGGAWLAATALIASAEPPGQAPGIYVEQTGGSDDTGVDRIPLSRPTRTGVKDIAKTVVKGMLTGGLMGGGPKMVVVFSGAQAPLRLSAQPMFQFHFDPKAAAQPAAPHDMASMMAMMGQSPSDMPPGIDRPQKFALVRLATKGAEREMEASTDMKPNRKHTVACRVRQLGPHLFRVAPEKPLPPGEYGFVVVGDGQSSGIDRLWDFGVDATSSAAAR